MSVIRPVLPVLNLAGHPAASQVRSPSLATTTSRSGWPLLQDKPMANLIFYIELSANGRDDLAKRYFNAR
jgi:hypothetical protein